MGNILRHTYRQARKWMWLLALSVIMCGSGTYVVSTFVRPVYQATAYLIVSLGAPKTSVTESLQAVPTYAQILTTSAVLMPVIAQHPGMSLQDLSGQLSVKQQANTQIIELDVQAGSPALAANLANQICQSFLQFAGKQNVSSIPAQIPTIPTQPRPLQDALIGSAVGLLLVLLLISLFEWLGNRATSPEQIQDLLGTEVIAQIPRFARTEARQAATERYQMICANLEMARAEQMFRLVMFTSAVEKEGTSTVASNVAIALAQTGKQVLLVDINIHRPVLAQRFALSSQQGLTDFLVKPGKDWQIERMSHSTDIPGLQVLPAGTQKMNSAEFLQVLASSQFIPRLQLTSYDYILLDAPPLLAVAETQMLAGSLDALVLVINAARTARETLRKAHQMLQKLPKKRVVGIVVNQASWHADEANKPYKPYALSQPAEQDELEVIIKQTTIELPAAHQLMLQPPVTHESGASWMLPQLQPIEAEPTRRYPLLLPQQRHPGLTQIGSDDLPITPRPGFLGQPTTGETEPVTLAIPEKIIRPQLSLHGLSMNPNGLLSRPYVTDELPDDVNMDQDKLKTRVEQERPNQ